MLAIIRHCYVYAIENTVICATLSSCECNDSVDEFVHSHKPMAMEMTCPMAVWWYLTSCGAS